MSERKSDIKDKGHRAGTQMAARMLEAQDEKTNRNSKDSVFVDLFHRPEYLLQLYQALHPEDTEVDEADLTIVTLKSLLIRARYNDLGFMVSNRLMVLIEAQSKWTYNILVRFLLYVSDTYNRYIRNNSLDVYGPKRLELPQLELYVIYTGDKDVPDEILLSRDILNTDHSDVEITARVLKDSTGGNIINQYIAFAKVNDEQVKIHGHTRKAVEETIRICRDRNILAEYLKLEEVANIMFYEVDVDQQLEIMRSEDREEGRIEGLAEGLEKGEINRAIVVVDNLVAEEGFSIERACKIASISMEEYNRYKNSAEEH